MTFNYSDAKDTQTYMYAQEECEVIWGQGNIDENPQFEQPGYWDSSETGTFFNEGDYHLKIESPCIDRGDPDSAYDPTERDIDGESRVMGVAIDMGGDEVAKRKEDISGDGLVNFLDFTFILDSWGSRSGGPEWIEACDLDANGRIGFGDVLAVAESWLWEAE